VGSAYLFCHGVGTCNAVDVDLWRREWESKMERNDMGNVTVLGERNVCLYMALFLQCTGGGISGGLTSASDCCGECDVLVGCISYICYE